MQKLQTNQQPDQDQKTKNYDQRLIVAALCIAAIFFVFFVMHSRYFNLVTTSNSLWDDSKDFAAVGLPYIFSSFVFFYLLPVLVRGRGQQRLKAVVLAALAVYFAFHYGEMIVENYVINR